MSDPANPGPGHRTQNWHVRKPAARSRRGIVASQHRLAAEVGAEMLAAGGNAVDAAVDWYLTLKVATLASELARYGVTREIWLPAGMPPVTPPDAPLRRLKLPGLADTLRRLARAGRRDFYEGEIAAAIAKDIRSLGG